MITHRNVKPEHRLLANRALTPAARQSLRDALGQLDSQEALSPHCVLKAVLLAVFQDIYRFDLSVDPTEQCVQQLRAAAVSYAEDALMRVTDRVFRQSTVPWPVGMNRTDCNASRLCAFGTREFVRDGRTEAEMDRDLKRESNAK